MIESSTIAVHAFTRCILTSLSVDERLLPKMHWEKACFDLHKNVTSYIEQILEARSHEITGVQPLIHITNHSVRAGYETRYIFKLSLTGLNTEFSFSLSSCLTRAEEPSLPYYLRITGGRIIGSIPFPRVLVLCEMQSVSSRIWTRIAVAISYDNNHYTTGMYLPSQKPFK